MITSLNCTGSYKNCFFLFWLRFTVPIFLPIFSVTLSIIFLVKILSVTARRLLDIKLSLFVLYGYDFLNELFYNDWA